MKIAYLGKIQLSDNDLSYLNTAQKMSDITYIMEVNPRFMKGPAYNISKLYPHSGIFKAVDAYPEFERYSQLIDIDKFYVVNTSGKLWHIKAFWTNFLLLLFLIKNKFDVIHLTWPANVYEFIIYLLRRKMILTVHDPFPHSGLDTKIVRLRRNVAFRLIRNFIILNKAQYDEFISFYKLYSVRVIVSRLSCYNNFKMVKPDMSVIPTSKYILFAGNISQYKGVEYLLQAMVKVHEKCPDVKLVVAGGGNYYFAISSYVNLDFIEIRNRVIPDEELVALIRNTEFMVCPYTDATQSGVIMSAYAFDTPVIATRVGGLPDMLGNGRFGMLIDEKNVNALSDAMLRLLENKDILQAYKANINDAYSGEGELSWTTIAKDLKHIYDSVSRYSQSHN